MFSNLLIWNYVGSEWREEFYNFTMYQNDIYFFFCEHLSSNVRLHTFFTLPWVQIIACKSLHPKKRQTVRSIFIILISKKCTALWKFPPKANSPFPLNAIMNVGMYNIMLFIGFYILICAIKMFLILDTIWYLSTDYMGY